MRSPSEPFTLPDRSGLDTAGTGRFVRAVNESGERADALVDRWSDRARAGANPVHRTTADLRMETGAKEKLVRTSLEAARDELVRGLGTLLDKPVPVTDAAGDGSVVVGSPASSALARDACA